MLGKNFDRQHFEIFVLFSEFAVSLADNLHQVSSAEFAKRMMTINKKAIRAISGLNFSKCLF